MEQIECSETSAYKIQTPGNHPEKNIQRFVFVYFFRKFKVKVQKYCRAGQATDGNMAHAHWMLGTKGYRHTHSKYVIIISLPLQQWLQKRPLILRYT
jgi:hypothetical protein